MANLSHGVEVRPRPNDAYDDDEADVSAADLERAMAEASRAFERVRELSRRALAQAKRSHAAALAVVDPAPSVPRLEQTTVNRLVWQYIEQHKDAYDRCREFCPRGDSAGALLRRRLFSRQIIAEQIRCRDYQVQRSPAWSQMQHHFNGTVAEVRNG